MFNVQNFFEWSILHCDVSLQAWISCLQLTSFLFLLLWKLRKCRRAPVNERIRCRTCLPCVCQVEDVMCSLILEEKTCIYNNYIYNYNRWSLRVNPWRYRCGIAVATPQQPTCCFWLRGRRGIQKISNILLGTEDAAFEVLLVTWVTASTKGPSHRRILQAFVMEYEFLLLAVVHLFPFQNDACCISMSALPDWKWSGLKIASHKPGFDDQTSKQSNLWWSLSKSTFDLHDRHVDIPNVKIYVYINT